MTASRCFCQLRFESGERVLISIAGQPHPSIKLLRLALGGLLPRETIWELDSVRLGGSESMARRVIALFLSDSDKVAHPLDAIRDSLLPCRSIQEALAVLHEKEGHDSTEFNLQQAQELVNKYGVVLEHSKSIIASENLLPAPKEQIKAAIVALARDAKASGASLELLEPLRVGYASLADFVSEESAQVARRSDELVRTGAQADMDDSKVREVARSIANSNPVDLQRKSTDDFALLAAEFDESLQD